MLFYSYPYIFVFLPVTALVYFMLNRRRLTVAAQVWLVLASLFFYGWWNPRYLPLILGSLLFNYGVATVLRAGWGRGALAGRTALVLGVAANLGLLGYFKYADFVLENVNRVAGTAVPALHLVLPLAISFFTFQQIAYLVDIRAGRVSQRGFLNYALFVTFFPQLISGPIVHHAEMMPQFAALRNRLFRHANAARGMFIFCLGLAKKVVLADTFARWAIQGFDQAQSLNLAEAWVTSLSYSLQLYFDFSGYMDMALGAALLFNIRLPINFDSPYKARSIREFWRRWHITLSRFLRDYVYVPLGGNRRGEARTTTNLMATFLLGGLWHGAGWTFIAWGALHGAAAALQRAWGRTGLRLPGPAAWAVTFLFVNAAWVFFRAQTWHDALKVLAGMAGQGAPLAGAPALARIGADGGTVALVAAGLLMVLFAPNSHALARRFAPTPLRAAALGLATGGLAIYVVIDTHRVTQFIYFGF